MIFGYWNIRNVQRDIRTSVTVENVFFYYIVFEEKDVSVIRNKIVRNN